LNLIVLISLKNVFFKSEKENNDVEISSDQVGISIVIAAKNESNNIRFLIQSLKRLIYNQYSFEVILVDDHSTDHTLIEIKKAVDRIDNFHVISLSDSEAGGKRNALTKGVENSRFQHLLITDADCRPEPKWLNTSSIKFSLGFDFIFGAAPFKQSKSIINKIACFENLRSSILTFSFAGIGLPYSAAARNFGFTKAAFEKVQGYSKTEDTLSGDDDLLLREAVKNRLKIGTVTDKGSFVYSNAKETFKDYLNQKARHTQTSTHYLLKHRLILGSWHLLNLFSLLSVGLMVFNPLWGILPVLKLLLDFVIVKFNEKTFGYRFNFFEVPFLQIVYELLLILHFISSIFMRVEWKKS
jgi:cellulose synthase/poly-beta-1,6-N-acetylglucosamine synthase-like glycosyltransferase